LGEAPRETEAALSLHRGARGIVPNALQITDPSADSDNPLAQAPSAWADPVSTGAALGTTVDRLGQWLSEQRAKSAKKGLWDDQTGLPTGAGLVNAAGQYSNALMMGTTAPGVRAFHGSPYDFERFDTSRIGTGEGAQAYGHGLYFAENESVAQSYRDELARKNQRPFTVNTGGPFGTVEMLEQDPTRPGRVYEVNIAADPEQFLHWDKPLHQQSDAVKQSGILPTTPEYMLQTGGEFLDRLSKRLGGSDKAAAALQQAGIPGIRYLDQGSRGAGEGTHNYVVFDANTIDILRKYGLAGLMLGAGGAAAGSQQQPPMAQ
jgi:hypothetical protein